MLTSNNCKKVFVTGASRGIGSCIARVFQERGFHVTGTRTSFGKIEDDYCDKWIVADFSVLDDIYSCAQMVREISPDVLINNAGINKISPFVDITPEDFLSIHQINVFAPFLLCQAAINGMKSRRWGRIVNISSIWGKVGKEHRASYAASKFALDGMTLAMAAEHSQNGVLANCIAPGFTDTELTRRVLGDHGINQLISAVPIRRMATPREVANFVAWLGSDDNSYITGQNIAVDGGFSRV